MTAALALQKAMIQALLASAELSALIGPDRVHDDVPPGAKPPYLVLDATSLRPQGGTAADGMEHVVSLALWSAAKGRSQALRSCDAVQLCLGEIVAIDPPHHLVTLEFVSAQLSRQPGTGLYQAQLQFRAFTE